MSSKTVSLATYLFIRLRQLGVGSVHVSSSSNHPDSRLMADAKGSTWGVLLARTGPNEIYRSTMGW